jgi:hypothetical protein
MISTESIFVPGEPPMRRMPTTPRFAPWKAAALALTLVAAGAGAQEPLIYKGHSEWNPIDSEIPRLPAYCKADFRPKLYPGPNSHGFGCGYTIGHLCIGMVALNRALDPMLPPKYRAGQLVTADDHLRQAGSGVTPTCKLTSALQAAKQEAKFAHMMVK